MIYITRLLHNVLRYVAIATLLGVISTNFDTLVWPAVQFLHEQAVHLSARLGAAAGAGAEGALSPHDWALPVPLVNAQTIPFLAMGLLVCCCSFLSNNTVFGNARFACLKQSHTNELSLSLIFPLEAIFMFLLSAYLPCLASILFTQFALVIWSLFGWQLVAVNFLLYLARVYRFLPDALATVRDLLADSERVLYVTRPGGYPVLGSRWVGRGGAGVDKAVGDMDLETNCV